MNTKFKLNNTIFRFEETGDLENKNSRTASCACPGEAETHGNKINIFKNNLIKICVYAVMYVSIE